LKKKGGNQEKRNLRMVTKIKKIKRKRKKRRKRKRRSIINLKLSTFLFFQSQKLGKKYTILL
jgi:hypothetical protein